MRLIDAEYALATSISGLIRIIEGESWIRVKEVRDSLKNVPTFDIDNIITEHENIGYEQGFRDGYAEAVDTKSVRHGHWVKSEKSDFCWECSECGYGGTDYKLTYCYDCGVRMDEEEDEDESY